MEQSPDAIGPHSKNVTVPVGSGRFPVPEIVIVAVSCTGVPDVTEPFVDACVVMLGTQLPKLPRTKSLSTASGVAEDRVSTEKLEKHSLAIPAGSSDRLMPPS